MPSAKSPDLRNFLHRLHRRAMMLRLAEYAGVGLAVSGILALPLIAIDWNQSRASIHPVLLMLAVGALTGMLAGIWRRPTVMQTAVVADRQLDLDDLLSTAIALAAGESGGPPKEDASAKPWQEALLAIADQTCRTHAASAVMFRRLSNRTWAGVGIVATFSLLLSTLATATITSGDNAKQSLAATDGSANPDPPARPLVAIAPDSKLFPTSPGGPKEGFPAGQNAADPVLGSAGKTPGETKSTPKNEASAESAGNASAGGTGLSQSKQPHVATPELPTPAMANSANTERPTSAKGQAAGGIGSANGLASAAGPAGKSGSGNGPSDASNTPAWASDRWKQAADTAREELTSGRVPPAYRSLVRDYFDAK